MDSSQIALAKSDDKAAFTAVQVDIPGSPPEFMRLCSGGFVSFDVDGDTVTFQSEDADYGVFGTYSPVQDGAENASVVTCAITIHPNANGFVSLTADGIQRSRVRVWEGYVRTSTGLVEGVPDLVFIGEIDSVLAPRSRNAGPLVLDCASQEQFQQIPDDQIRLNHTWLQSVYGSGVLGLIHVHEVATYKRYWQMPSPGIRYTQTGGGNNNLGGEPGGNIPGFSFV
jgi:hypothetical protein